MSDIPKQGVSVNDRRAALIERYFEGVKTRDIAKEFDCTPASVSSIVRRYMWGITEARPFLVGHASTRKIADYLMDVVYA